MISRPSWLCAFPFIERNWLEINQLQEKWNSIDGYDLATDWTAFKAAHPSWDVFKLLRRFRTSRLAWLSWQDIGLPVEQHIRVLHAVSQLADWLITQACDEAAEWIKERHGQVLNAQGKPMKLMVFALGKLGTFELNYSSDIDLVFVYPEQGVSNGARPLEAEQYFMRQGRRIIKLLDHVTAEGRVYQVDMRLRPFGSAAPLVCSAAGLHHYLVNEGRTWERFAWMRGRAVYGEQSDCDQVQRDLSGFIYRKHLDYTVFDALLKIKADITREMYIAVDDLKMGDGGIRYIEFIIQSLQMVFGGRNQDLRGTAVYPQFARLQAAGKLTPEDQAHLSFAWLWLRKAENGCQMMSDQASHQLPEDPVLRRHLAQAMGLEGASELKVLLDGVRKQVSQIFSQMFQEPGHGEDLDANQQQQLSVLFKELNWSRMTRDTALKVRELLEKTVLMTHEEVQLEFVRLVRAISKRPGYLMMLLKEPMIHEQVLNLLSAGSYFRTTLVQYPVLLEQLFEQQPKIGLRPEDFARHWQFDEGADEEQWMEQCRYFKLQQQFNLQRAHTEELLSGTDLQQGFAGLAEFILGQVLQRSWQETRQKVACQSIGVSDLMVIAYGSLATRQMHIQSDLDLVFVLDHNQPGPNERQFMQRWVRRLTHHLISPMYHGLLYEIDLQLRPNGKSGTLVTTRKEFARYQREDAWIWEHAAMIKSRLVIGDREQKHWHASLRAEILTRKRNPSVVDQAMNEMAEKLEQLGGKPHHQEFKVLAGVLKHANDHPELVKLIDLVSMRNALRSFDLLEA